MPNLEDLIFDYELYIDNCGGEGVVATIDFETRSAFDIRHGAYKYSKHKSTKPLCLKYRLPHFKKGEVKQWNPELIIPSSSIIKPSKYSRIKASENPIELFAWILAGGLVEAHNAFFERCIWTNIMVPKYKWPEIKPNQWRCSAAKASAASLPRSLEEACKAMNLSTKKDMEGSKVMKKLSKPRKPLKAEKALWKKETGKPMLEMPFLWHESVEEFHRLFDYCETDVLAEEALSKATPELIPQELQVWQMDQEINWRGTRFDLELAHAALHVVDEYKKILNQELYELTGIVAGTQRQTIKEWLAKYEKLELSNTAAETVDWYLEHEKVSPLARRVCQILKEVNKTSTRKYKAMIDKADDTDDKIRDLLMYHGAGTGRWAGKGVQVQNLPARNLIVKDFEVAASTIKTRDVNWCNLMYEDVMQLLSHTLRGAIIPSKGYDFMTADYSAIEARCVLWEANATKALKVFYEGGDIYCDMAAGIYGYPVNKKDHKEERQFGKQAVLGLGYGMGFITFLLTCRKYGMSFPRNKVLKILGSEKLSKYEDWVFNYLELDNKRSKGLQARRSYNQLVEARENPNKILHELALMKYTVNVYRKRYPEIKQLWTDQEQAAIRAVRTGEEVSRGVVTWFVKNNWLYCKLPSGRSIMYREPQIKSIKTSWGEMRPALRYMSVNGVTRKWCRTATYGGKIVENITQGIARDIMANAMLRINKSDNPYRIVMSVHDEIVAEVPTGQGSVKDFEKLMSEIPVWATGCPINAEGERLTRYKK